MDDAQNIQEKPRPGGDADDASASDSQVPRASRVIAQYLMERVPEYRELTDLRKRGWENPAGDKFFEKQRNRADKADNKMSFRFYNMMKNIGKELHENTGSFEVRNQWRPYILDMCMAPGGFLETALSLNPGSHARAFSLPLSDGGNRVFLPKDPNVSVQFLDITMLAAEMGMADIPAEHEDAGNFLPTQFQSKQEFDIVLCDGQVLRTQRRASYRETREAQRLMSVQLALGLEQVRNGGTMVVLLHHVERWDTVLLLQTFSKFASIKLYKPKKGHAIRSSFYMVAKDINTERPEAVLAVKGWKDAWRLATFETNGNYYREGIRRNDPSVAEVLENFGPDLISLAMPVWQVQAEALARVSFCN